MFRLMFLENNFEESIEFSSLEDMLVVAVGFDKSAADFVGCWRPCNRRGGNSAAHVQQFACLEGPVAENHQNELVTIGDPAYPIKSTIQHLVDDHLHAISITASAGGQVTKCACFVFLPVPLPPPCKVRPITMHLCEQIIYDSDVVWSTAGTFSHGGGITEGSPDHVEPTHSSMMPTVPVSLGQNSITTKLVLTTTDPSHVVGLVFEFDGFFVASHKLSDPLQLYITQISDL